jgi:predicted O-linked N-acetylglucosamine transferase (SPINDLY family)
MKFATPQSARQQAGAAHRIAAAEAYWREGLARAQVLDWAAAERSFARATALAPRDALFWTNLANAQRKRGEFRQAAESARRAFGLDRTDTLACKLYATCLMQQNRHDEAIAVFERLDPGAPRDHDFHVEYGEALYRAGRVQESVGQFIASFSCKPDFVPAHARLANALARLGLHEEAAEAYRTVAVLSPNDAQSLGNVVHQNQHACRWERVAEDTRRLLDVIERGLAQQTPPFTHLALESDAREQLLCARTSAAFEFGRIAPLPPSTRPPRPEGERLRIGYLSNDFHHHATAMLMVEMLERHDRSRFDVRLYSYAHDDGTPMRRRVAASSEHFVDVTRMSDREAAQRIRDDGIDVLVDLKGYTRGSRMHLLAYRPAPVQAQFLGYPGTTGADCVDYVIGDATVTPLSMAECFSERIAQLPDCYQPNDRARPLPPAAPRADCGLPEGAFVFCCFNSNYKITERVFDRWCAVLRAVPGSVLWLYEANPQASRNLLREAAARGVDASRIVFAPFLPVERHIARLRNADLFLDTLPYNAHTTASDALWAGVPLLTCIGGTFAGRVAASLLRTVGLPQLVTESMDAYERLAIELARDPGALAAIRAHLEAVRGTTPLFDAQRFARSIEALYERMAARHRLGLLPDHLPAC